MKNIKNVKYLDKLKNLGYDLDNILIVGSGTMSLFGLKSNNDIDLWVTKKVYAKMLKDSRFSPNGKMLETKDKLIEADYNFPCVKDKVEDQLKRAVVVNGFYFQSLQDVLDWKKCMNRPKDREHVKMIEKYMKTNIVESYLLELQELNLIFKEFDYSYYEANLKNLDKQLFDSTYDRQSFRKWLVKAIVALIQQTPVGFYTLKSRNNNPKICSIHSLGVEPKYRGKGIGQKLIGHAIKTCIAFNFKYVDLGVDKDNKIAIHLYMKNGFKIIEEMKTRYILRKKL
jgi:ribosomal protein S18 acetylase RimI-like enzyme